jgi:hypothetical protein
MHSKVVVQLGGGIGNQLFQYYAGQLLAQKLNKRLSLDDSSLRWEYANILRKELGLPQSGLRSVVPEYFPKVKIENKPIHTFRKILRKILTLLGFYVEFNFYGEVDSTRSLLNISENNTKRTIILKGNLQSHTIVEKALQLGAREIKPIESAQILDNDKKPIIVHIRLTDYVVENIDLMIPPEYYKLGLGLAVKDYPDRAIWLFSDDPESALAYFPDQFRDKLEFVNDPKKNSDWDELQLMSVGCAYVIPNSTFGFWAASLSKASLVICPSPWFKSSPSPKDNTHFDFPNHWTQLDW